MIGTSLKLALRHLKKRPLHTGLNVVGLAVGLACCLLIGRYVHHEWNYDRFHENADRIFRVTNEVRTNNVQRTALSNGTYGPLLEDIAPQVLESVRMARRTTDVRQGNEVIHEQTLLFADAAFFDVFSFPLRQGNAATALAAPQTIVLTEAAARRYFGDAEPLGQSVELGEGGPAERFEVTGIVADPPPNSHLQFDALLSFETIVASGGHERGGFWTYLLLQDAADAGAMPTHLEALVERLYGPEALDQIHLHLQPLTDIHLHSRLIGDVHEGGSAQAVTILAIIALFVLLIACINFVNLSTARAGERAREVGVRKVVGARRSGLVLQFLAESLATAGLAVVLGWVLSWMALPLFNDLTGQAFSAADLLDGPFLLLLLGIAALVGFLAGLYPAFVLSAFAPVQVLKGGPGRAGGARFRQGLVVLQFTLTIALLASTLLAFRQLDYVRHKDLGFDKEHVVSIPVHQGSQFVERLREAWTQLPAVAEVTADSRGSLSGAGRRLLGQDQDTSYTWINYYHVADDYIEVMDIDVLAGRVFASERASDSLGAAVLNAAAVKAIGWPEPERAVGQVVGFGPNRWRVIGVVDDFHYGSLHQAVEPLLLLSSPSALRHLLVRLRPGQARMGLAALETSWHQHVPDAPFSYAFADDDLARLYEEDRRLGRAFGVFAALAIFIACLGLFGLAVYSAGQRTKEIGIRKVMGAGVPDVVRLLVGEFVRLVVLAFVLATPLAYYAMQRWLEGFAYRIDIGWSAFVLSGLAAVIVAVLTVGWQSLRAALTDPAETLRYE